MTPPSTYVIPPTLSTIKNGKYFLAIPAAAAVGALTAPVWAGTGYSLETLGAGAVAGMFAGIPVTIVLSLVFGIAALSRAKKVWASHNYAWYRASFPDHVLSEGRVSCRHCGGRHLQARNLMNHTFVRAHSCAQCGETLYFSPEKV